MNDNNLNKKFFREADSPIPLLPPDMAWSNMEQKLNAEKKKKRGFFFWLFPITGLAVLLMGAGVLLWWHPHHHEIASVKTDTNNVQDREFEPEKNNGIVVNKKRIQNEPIAGKYKAKNEKQILQAKPKLIAADVVDDYPEKRSRFEKDKALPGETDNTLPFAFPKQLRFADSILVRANVPLPASLFREPVHSDSNRKKEVWVQAGLQWNLPVTSNELNYYAKGPSGSNQLYRLLLPGAWISLNKNKQRLMATVNPFFTAPTPVRSYDSIGIFDKQTIKTFGLQAGIQYGYQLTGHWWIGGGVDANWWKKGVVFSTNDSMGTFIYPVNLKKEKLVPGFQISANVTTGYQFKACEGFLQLSVPFNKRIKSQPTPIWMQLGVRWRLLNLKCKQQ